MLHTPSAPPPQAPDNVAAPEGGGGGNRRGSGAGGAAHQGSIHAGLATAPLQAPLGARFPQPMAPAPPRHLASPANPAAMPVWVS